MFQNILKTTLILCILFCASFVFAQANDYKIQPEDVLEIKVYEHDDLTTQTRVTSNGDISFPLLGKVNVLGVTVSDLKDSLTLALEKDYLVSAQVNVFIKEYHAKQVVVLGAVKTPGKYSMFPEKPTSVLEAIAMAGGFSDVASINGTRVVRTQENGKEKTIPVRVTDITQKGKKELDIALQPGDIVFVPESFF
jgi:polysaccharide export outer membrane protein